MLVDVFGASFLYCSIEVDRDSDSLGDCNQEKNSLSYEEAQG
jgi:hypothetical protein